MRQFPIHTLRLHKKKHTFNLDIYELNNNLKLYLNNIMR